jgi:hypothetical protein
MSCQFIVYPLGPSSDSEQQPIFPLAWMSECFCQTAAQPQTAHNSPELLRHQQKVCPSHTTPEKEYIPKAE